MKRGKPQGYAPTPHGWGRGVSLWFPVNYSPDCLLDLAAFFSFCISFFCLLDLGGAFCTFFCSLLATKTSFDERLLDESRHHVDTRIVPDILKWGLRFLHLFPPIALEDRPI